MRGPCTHPELGGSGWYLYAKMTAIEKWRSRTSILVHMIVFCKYIRQAATRPIVMRLILNSGLPEELRERIYIESNVMPYRNENYICCKTKLSVDALKYWSFKRSHCSLRCYRGHLLKLYAGGKTSGAFRYIKNRP